MKSFIVSLLALFALTSVGYAADSTIHAPKGTYKLDPTHASLTWRVNHMGLSNYTARFTVMDATLDFDPADVTGSKLTATVDPTSVETDYPNPETEDFDHKLQKDEKFFNADKFSEIKFVSTKVERAGDNKAKLYGNLTLLGKTKSIVLDVTYNGSMKEHPYAKAGAIGFSATGAIKRSEWGMDYGIPHVGDEVQLLIEAEFFEQKKP
jgi:polyisoprenoid-binding protein YceI